MTESSDNTVNQTSNESIGNENESPAHEQPSNAIETFSDLIGSPDENIEAIESTPERPEYLLDKYKTVEEQAKAYKEAQKILGRIDRIEQYVGVEEQYSIPEKYKDSELAKDFSGFLKDKGFNQKFFNEALEFVEKYEQINDTAQQDLYKSLGDNAEERISNVKAFVRNNFPPEIIPGLKQMPATPEAIQFFEHVRDMITQTGVPTTMSTGNIKTDTIESVKREMVENREKMRKDPEYAKLINNRLINAGAKPIEVPYAKR